MHTRTPSLLVGLLVSVFMVALIMRAVRGSPYLAGPDDYEDVTLALWSSLSPI